MQAQPGKAPQFHIERREGKVAGTVIFRLSGPFTSREVFGHLTPQALADMLHSPSADAGPPPQRNILDLTEVPYMDSASLGLVMKHFAHCKSKGVTMLIAGATPRVLELFRLTKVDSVIPLAPSFAEAEGR
jgi:anti-anti-sigma factor